MKILVLLTLSLHAILALTANGQDVKPIGPPEAGQNRRSILVFSSAESLFQTLNGKWLFGQTDCAKAFTIEAAADRRTIRLTYPETPENPARQYVYKVLAVDRRFVRAQIEGEKRLTSEGKPVVWDFIFLSTDEFVWRRTDWLVTSSGNWSDIQATPPVTRCPAEKVPA